MTQVQDQIKEVFSKHKWARPTVIFGLVAIAAYMIFSPSGPASALTGADIVDKMTDDEKMGFYAGSIGMAALLSRSSGNEQRANCITTWFYRQNGGAQLDQALERYKDREAQPVIYALIQQKCGQ